MGRVATAARVFRRHGAGGVMSALKDRYLDNWIGRRIEWCYGKALECRGNTIEIDGCIFSLDSPAITTESKSKFMFNQYERPEREAVRRFLDPALPVVEFGGSIGVISCLTNRRLVAPERHVVVEANAALVPLLLRNRDRNQCRFTVLPRMVAYGSARAPFYADSTNFVIGSAIPTEARGAVDTAEVQTIDLRSILDQHQFERCTLICDIEGGESDLVKYESDVLRKRVTTFILEVHEWAIGKDRVGELLKEIGNLGFEGVFSESDTYTFQRGTLQKS
jgi:FkbM family methyltransferase